MVLGLLRICEYNLLQPRNSSNYSLAVPTKIPKLALGLLVIPTRLYQRLSQLQVVLEMENPTRMMNILEIDRLILCRLTIDDAAFILDLLNDSLFLRFIGDKGVRTRDDQECKQFAVDFQ